MKSTYKEPADGSVRVFVSVKDQRLDVMRGREVVASYPVSTAANGIGFEEGSFRTPTGRFRIAEKIGDGAPLWAVFRARKATGEIAREGPGEDLVLTRILWLDGLDEQNANTHSRYIYVHGTNHETLLGSRASHGCVRLSNRAMVQLFDLVSVGTPVEIA